MKYYTDPNGNYFTPGYGGFNEGNPLIPGDAIEVPSPPETPGQTWNGSAWVFTKPYLADFLANYRWEKETNGITFGGLPIRTDERSRSLLAGIQKQLDVENNPTATRKVKTVAGFYDISNASMFALYQAVAAHIQLCFDCEYSTLLLINNDTLTTPAQVSAAFDEAYDA